jgi:hypothetical protein
MSYIYIYDILPVVLCGCETWSLTLREKRRLRVFENRVRRRIFGPWGGGGGDEATRVWRKLYEELNDPYCSRNIGRVIKSRRIRWAGHVARMGEKSGIYKVLVGKPEGKRALGRPKRRWEDSIKIVGSGIWGHGLDRAGSEQGQVAGTCYCGNEASGTIKCGEYD